MSEKAYLKPEDIAPHLAKRVLDFLNSAKNAEEIKDITDIPGENDIGIGMANKIIEAREKVGHFTSLKQVDSIKGIGPERFTELVTALIGKRGKILENGQRDPEFLLIEEGNLEVGKDQRAISPEDIERALQILLRAIALASTPQFADTRTTDTGMVDKEVGGYPAIEIVRRDGCECPCPDGITAEFLIEWDAPGPFNYDLFSDSLIRGRTKNPRGKGTGTTIEVEGDKTISLNFKNPKLGVLNTGDIIVTFTLKPFFGGEFDEDRCCVTARGSFAGTASIASYTDRGEASGQVEYGQTNINQTISVGKCDIEKGQKPCCTVIYRWNFSKRFTLKALGFDVESDVQGIITVNLQVWEIKD